MRSSRFCVHASRASATVQIMSSHARETARGPAPGSFALVMATGIVSDGLRQDGLSGPADGLLVVAATAFAVLLIASAWRAVTAPGQLRADLASPGRAFTSFAFVAASSVLGSGLAGAGLPATAAALAILALAAWLTLTWIVPIRLVAHRPAIADVNGTWYLWAVATQSLAVAAAYLQAAGFWPPGIAVVVATAAWSAGLTLYLITSVLVVTRLAAAGLGRAGIGERAPYWVAMGAASISLLAAARILTMPGPLADSAAIATVAVTLWAIATPLLLVLAIVTAVLSARAGRWFGYRQQLWTVVFPLGMYAVASMTFGVTARHPVIREIGAAVLWPAMAAWTATFIAMSNSLLRSRMSSRASGKIGADGGAA